MRALLTFAILFFTLISWGETIKFKGEEVDTIQIISHVGAYQFDKRGTTVGRSEILTIIFSDNEKSYVISDHYKENFIATFEPKSLDKKRSTVKKEMGTGVNDTLILMLLESLARYENPIDSYAKMTSSLLVSYVNEKTILEVAKRYEAAWQFKMRYTTREQNAEFFKGMQSIDTFNLYLGNRFDTAGYVMVTDYSNAIDLRIVTQSSQYLYEGKYPNPLKQPWYSSGGVGMPVTLNLNINRALECILPKDFLNKSSISEKALMADYITWYLQRTKVIY